MTDERIRPTSASFSQTYYMINGGRIPKYEKWPKPGISDKCLGRDQLTHAYYYSILLNTRKRNCSFVLFLALSVIVKNPVSGYSGDLNYDAVCSQQMNAL